MTYSHRIVFFMQPFLDNEESHIEFSLKSISVFVQSFKGMLMRTDEKNISPNQMNLSVQQDTYPICII